MKKKEDYYYVFAFDPETEAISFYSRIDDQQMAREEALRLRERLGTSYIFYAKGQSLVEKGYTLPDNVMEDGYSIEHDPEDAETPEP